MKRALVCHSRDGLDEVSTSAPTDVSELRNGKVTRWVIKPRSFGIKAAKIADYAGGNTLQNKKIALALLQGKLKGPARDIVELNAAIGLYLCGKAANVKEGLERARGSLDQNNAYESLETLIRISHS